MSTTSAGQVSIASTDIDRKSDGAAKLISRAMVPRGHRCLRDRRSRPTSCGRWPRELSGSLVTRSDSGRIKKWLPLRAVLRGRKSLQNRIPLLNNHHKRVQVNGVDSSLEWCRHTRELLLREQVECVEFVRK